MSSYSKRFLTLVLVSYLAMISPAFAISKLDFTGPLADVKETISKIQDKIENIQTRILEEKEKWTKKAEAFLNKNLGTEGAALFKSYVVEPGAGVVKGGLEGQYNAGRFGFSGFTDAFKNELGNYKLEYASLVAQYNDMVETAERAKLEKEMALDAVKVKLSAQLQALNKLYAENEDPEIDKEIKSLELQISDINRQITELSNERIIEGQAEKEMLERISALQGAMASLEANLSQDSLLKKLDSESLSLFSDLFGREEVKEVYANNIEKLFLGKYEFASPENIARVRTARKEEFFKAEKNMLKAIVDTYNSMKDTNERMERCRQASEKAQALFGSEAMRVCVDVQIAKISAQYLQALLSKIQFESIDEIQKWTDKYRLPDYNRDYTKFNLDDYVVKKEDLQNNFDLSKEASKFVDENLSSSSSILDKLKK